MKKSYKNVHKKSHKKLIKLFNLIDSSNNGLIDEKDLAKLLVSIQLPYQYAKLCIFLVAGDKKEINIHQFVKFIDILALYKNDKKEFYNLLFMVFDHNESGTIDLDELLLFLEYLDIIATPGQVTSILSISGVNIIDGLSQEQFIDFLIGLEYGFIHPDNSY